MGRGNNQIMNRPSELAAIESGATGESGTAAEPGTASESGAAIAPTRVRPAVLVVVFGLLSAVAGALPSFSLSANLLVVGTGGVLFWVGVSQPSRRAAPARLPAVAVVWAVPVTLFVVVELTTFLIGSKDTAPTLSRLADPVLEQYLARSALFFGWLAAFWGLVRR